MKLSIPAATISSLLTYSGFVLSKHDSYVLAETATKKRADDAKTKPVVVDPAQIDWEEKSRRLRLKLKAKKELRKKMESRGVQHLAVVGRECTPVWADGDADVGILACSDPDHVCIEDSSSSFGGVCAQLVSDDGSGDGILQDESTRKLKLLTHGSQLMAQDIIEASPRVGEPTLLGEECEPSTSKGYFDIGACSNTTHVCVEDTSSLLGGTCVDIGQTSEFLTEERLPAGPGPIDCTYINGTKGKKCHGGQSCVRSNVDNIGCGSCYGFRSCVGLTGKVLDTSHSQQLEI